MSAFGRQSSPPRHIGHRERRRRIMERAQYFLAPNARSTSGVKKAIRREARRRGIPTSAMIRKLEIWAQHERA